MKLTMDLTVRPRRSVEAISENIGLEESSAAVWKRR